MGETVQVQRDDGKTITRHRPRKKPRRRLQIRHPYFWMGLGLYAVVLLLLAARFLKYTDRCLVEYEAAQPEKCVDTYVKDFAGAVLDGVLSEKMNISNASETFEEDDVYRNAYASQLADIKAYTFEKDPSSYITEEPVYDIYGDGVLVAKVTLSASNARTIFGILSIMDWDVKQVEAVLTAETHAYSIQVPDNYQVTVNGVALTAEALTGKKEVHPEFENILPYVDIPEIVEYQVTGLLQQPDIRIFDAAGTPIAYEQDEAGNVAVGYPHADELPQAYYDTALLIARTWDDFLTDDLEGANHGLATVQQYLVRDSYYWNIAVDYAGGIDITFISPHTLLDPPCANICLTDFTLYSENCFSCHVYFEKNMYLTVTGQTMVNTIDSIFYFVQYDDTDDGVDNPHWTIADMEAYVNENP